MSGLQVLIVEDDAVSATLHKAMLESEGHSIVGVARSEEEAIELARTGAPDLVLMDIYLEDGTSGVHAAKDMYSSYSLPVIFVTCGSAVEQLQELVDSDAFALIKKPVSLEELRVNLSIVMRRASEIKKNKERSACYEALIDLLPVAMFSVRDNRLIDWCNMSCARALEYDSPQELQEQCTSIDGLIAEDDESLLYAKSETRFRQAMQTATGEVVFKTLYKIERDSLSLHGECCFFVLE